MALALSKSVDAFRTISEVADELNVPQHVLRFWETRFSQIKPMKRAGGRRYYRPQDVDIVRGIKALLYGEGYTIRGVQRIVKEEGVVYLVGVGRGEIKPRASDARLEGAPPPGRAKTAPRYGRAAPAPGRAPLAPIPGEGQVSPSRLSPTHTEALQQALRELGEAKSILSPTPPPAPRR